MPDRRFEDKVSVQDLMKKPQKELLTMIYIQTCKTNGTVQDHEERLDKLENYTALKVGIGIISGLIILFNVLNYFVG